MAVDGGARTALVTARPWSALGLVAGPAAFIGGWLVGGARTPDYSPVNDAISRIAAVGASERALMTAAFVTYGASVIVGSTALRTSPLRRCWSIAAVNGAATIAVAALPLEHSSTMDTWHGVAAGIGYVSITVLQLASAKPLRATGHDRAAALALAGGVTSGLCLVATTVTDANGFFQRLGLTVGDVWLVATGIALFRAGRAERRR
ncbi:DUF998 domain-containing protein [Aquihabitans daechungensis]|uniref:DUF998 domain-containing protein n=1 Tax=Aquihabitans daechungensis TaxID=1052257 RepID=UPI003BA175BF